MCAQSKKISHCLASTHTVNVTYQCVFPTCKIKFVHETHWHQLTDQSHALLPLQSKTCFKSQTCHHLIEILTILVKTIVNTNNNTLAKSTADTNTAFEKYC